MAEIGDDIALLNQELASSREEILRLRGELEKRDGKSTAAVKPSSQAQKAQATVEDDEDPSQYFENRLKFLALKKEAGINPYPHKFSVSMSMIEFTQKYGGLNDGERCNEDVQVSLAGRIMSIRASSSKIFFYDLHEMGANVQVMADARSSELGESEFVKLHSDVKHGDIVGVTGIPGKTKRGELSIFSKSFVVLSHCLHKMPRPKAGSGSKNNNDTRYRQRYLDLILNPEVKAIFESRAKIIQYVRRFLDGKDFLEVETSVMNLLPVGKLVPFVTHHNELNMRLYMRIAPELYLKQLIVGGYSRVYEIGKQFRNEGIDPTHNTEFTTCEFYMAFADYHDLLKVTEDMLSGMVKELTGGYVIKYHANGLDQDPIEIDFTPPFRRIDMIGELEKTANLNIPKDLASEEANLCLNDACTKLDVECLPPRTTPRLLDRLVGHFLENKCVNPTFIMDHPEATSPLAKWHRSRPGLTERFELFINKYEVCNAYTELNDPVIQRERFAEQLKDRRSGDDEAMAMDDSFCMSLEYGLPPTAGWGMGIDRLTMLLTDSQNIQEVIFFPTMKPQDTRSYHL